MLSFTRDGEFRFSLESATRKRQELLRVFESVDSIRYIVCCGSIQALYEGVSYIVHHCL